MFKHAGWTGQRNAVPKSQLSVCLLVDVPPMLPEGARTPGLPMRLTLRFDGSSMSELDRAAGVFFFCCEHYGFFVVNTMASF